jgi:YD repeat-containing protein
MDKKEGYSLQGSVRSVRIERLRLEKRGSHSEEVLLWSQAIDYDTAGRETESSHYDPQGSLRSRTAYRYDPEGREIERISYDAGGTFIRRMVSTYNEEGRLSRQIVYRADGTSFVQRSATFDDAGRRIVEAYFPVDASESSPTSAPHEKRGVVIVVSPISGSDAHRNRELYDADDKLLEVISYRADGGLKSRFLFSYDSAGRRIREAQYMTQGAPALEAAEPPASEATYVYDEAGRVQEVAHYSNGSLQDKTIYRYDANGNRIEEERYGTDGLLRHRESYVREVDGRGNWTRETKVKRYPQLGDRELIVVTNRTIIYY